MTLHRRSDLEAAPVEKRKAIDKYPADRFPIQHEIMNLQKELNDFNERIAELEQLVIEAMRWRC